MKAWFFVLVEVARRTSFGWFNAAVWSRNFQFWPVDQSSPTIGRPTSLAMYATWDSQHYLYLATHGYRHAEISMVFFPGWPLLLSLGGDDPRVALALGLVLANLCSAGALWLLHRLVAKRHDETIADLTIVLILSFPTAFFLCVPYSESLFLLLTVGALALLAERRFALTALVALLAATVRPLGLCLAVPLGFELLRQRQWLSLPLCLVPLLGFAVHRAVVAHQALGGAQLADYSALFVAHQSPWNVVDLPRLASLYLQPLRWHGVVDSAIDRIVFGLTLVVGAWGLKRRDDRAWTLYALALCWVAGTATSLVSFTRYALCAFPLFVIAAQLLAQRRWSRAINFAVALPLQLLFMLRHIHNYWVG